MVVYVDDMYTVPMGKFRRMRMSHMIADTEDELHKMAAAIGVARRWYQGDHYDVCMSARTKAVKLGAKEIEMRELARLSRKEGLPRKGNGLVPPVGADPTSAV